MMARDNIRSLYIIQPGKSIWLVYLISDWLRFRQSSQLLGHLLQKTDFEMDHDCFQILTLKNWEKLEDRERTMILKQLSEFGYLGSNWRRWNLASLHQMRNDHPSGLKTHILLFWSLFNCFPFLQDDVSPGNLVLVATSKSKGLEILRRIFLL